MYTFEHFTEDTKRVLELAQEEALRSHHSYIGTEHVLLGILREGDGIAAQALRDLDVGIVAVREVISHLLGRNERIIIQQLIPTSRVRRVIEIAFAEAQREGTTEVDSGHLLVGLMIEADGIAAHVLQDLGATRERIDRRVDELRRLRDSDPTPSPTVARPASPSEGRPRPADLLMSAEVQSVLDRAGELARRAGERLVGMDHLRRALAEGRA